MLCCLALCFVAIFLTVVNGECQYCHHLQSGVPSGFTRVTYVKSEELLENPRRGFWREKETKMSTFRPLTLEELDGRRKSGGLTVIQRIYVLDTFRTKPLSFDFKARFHNDMTVIREASMTVVLRFCYDFNDPQNPPYGDTTKEWVLKHIHQLSPLFHEFVDIIDTVQAGFIGTWGEWYYTDHFGTPQERNYHAYPHTYGYSPQSIEDRREVIKAVIDAVPLEIQVQQRHPWWNRMIYGPDPPTRDDVVHHTYKGRTGFHNDCFLANKNDQGTYKEIGVAYPYMHELTKYLVVGGETCAVSPPDPGRHNCSVALHEMAYFHWTYLNIGFYKPVLKDWQKQGCFNDIFRNMGYRFVLKESILPSSVHIGSDFCFRIVFRNEGYAAPFRNWDISFVLRRGSSHFAARMRKRDMSLWLPGNDIVIEANIHVPSNLGHGTYETFLVFTDSHIPHKSDYNILMANKHVPDHRNGVNNLQHTILMISGGHQHVTSSCPALSHWTPPAPSKYNRTITTVEVS